MPLIGGSQALPFDPRLVGERFERERELLGFSRAELAAQCEYSAEQVRRVERGEQAPGARLLAALAELGGDVRAVLLDAGERQRISEAEEIYRAQYREQVHREAREWSRLKGDRRKKRLDDDEADLIDWFRQLSEVNRRQLLDVVQQMAEDGAPLPLRDEAMRTVVTASHGGIAAGRNVSIKHAPASKKPKK